MDITGKSIQSVSVGYNIRNNMDSLIERISYNTYNYLFQEDPLYSKAASAQISPNHGE